MTEHPPRPPYLRLVVSGIEEGAPTAIPRTAERQTELDRLLAPYVTACREIIAAATTAALDTAAAYGLRWDVDAAQAEIREAILRQTHAALFADLNQRGIDPEMLVVEAAQNDGSDH